MRYIKIIGLCLMAVSLVGAVASATATATLPGFLFTVNHRAFSSKGGASFFHPKVSRIMECKSESDTGEIANEQNTDKVENVLIVFRECKANAVEQFNCQSEGQPQGQIKTEQLEGNLGYIKSTAPKEVGLVLKPTLKRPFAEFECVNKGLKYKVKITGEVIGKITPINTPVGPEQTVTKFTVSYIGGTINEWEQVPNKLEVLGATLTELLLSLAINGGESEFTSLSTKDEIFPLAKTEIDA